MHIEEKLQYQFEAGKSVNVVPLPAELVHPGTRTALWILFGAVFFLLLIACANVASLLLARQGSRERDSAIRIALGASRARLVRLQMLECLLLALFSALPGLALAAAAVPVLRGLGPAEIRGFADAHLDLAILIFCLFVSLLTGLVFGLPPSWITARRDPQAALKAGGRSVAGSLARRRMGSLFMSLQIALAMVLVTGTGLMIRSLVRVENVELGYQPRGLLLLHLNAPSGRQPAQFYDEALGRIGALPGVQGVGAIDAQFSDYIPDDVIEVEGWHSSNDSGAATCRRFQTWLLSAFSAIAFFLAAIGTYGLISYSVSERIHEIGIRMALGASRTDVVRMVLAQASRTTGVGLLVGMVSALAFSRAASSLLFGVSWDDTLTLSLTAGLLVLTALVAAYVPARRATRVDPSIALSSER